MHSIDLRIGLAIWGYKGWLGGLFPSGSQTRDFLSLYVERFNCVEGNTTFYATPDAATVARWAVQMPANFRFCPKLPKAVTHSGALYPKLPMALQFLEYLKPLGERLGPLFVQLPPRYGPQQFDDLNQFLQGWTAAVPDVPVTVEVRHIDWFSPEHALRLNAVLEDLDVGRVLLDSRPIYEGRPSKLLDSLPAELREKKPRVPLQPIVTTNYAFVRYISHPDLDRNHQYLLEWVDWVQQWGAAGKTIYFFVHCPYEEHSPQNAQLFQLLLEAADLMVPELPWNCLPTDDLDSTEQLSLF